MLKNRSLLSGLGVGLILGSVMLQSVVAVDQMERSPEQAQTSAQQLSVPQLKEIAVQKGYVLYPKDEVLLTKAQAEEAKTKAIEEARSNWTQQPSKGPAAGSTDGSAHKKGVYIKPGLDASTVAERLQEFGVISDKAKFVESIVQQKLNTKIQFGYFQFEPNVTLQDVIAAVTSPQ